MVDRDHFTVLQHEVVLHFGDQIVLLEHLILEVLNHFVSSEHFFRQVLVDLLQSLLTLCRIRSVSELILKLNDFLLQSLCRRSILIALIHQAVYSMFLSLIFVDILLLNGIHLIDFALKLLLSLDPSLALSDSHVQSVLELQHLTSQLLVVIF